MLGGHGGGVWWNQRPFWIVGFNRGLTELAERVGITIVNLSILKNGRARAIRFTTLASLCQVLGCQPGDLLSYQPDSRPRDGAAGTPPQ